MATTPDYAGVEDSIKQGYDAQRQKAAQAEAGNLQGQRDALARRQAQLGGGPGGAFVKAEQQAGNDSAQRAQAANASINDAQASELRGVKLTQLGQQYGTSEREAGQGFQAGQQAKTFAHEDTSQQTGIQAAREQQQTGIQAAAAQQKTGIEAAVQQQKVQIDANSSLQDRQLAAQAIMQDKGITAQSTLQERQIAAQVIMQKTGLDAQAAMQAVGITAQEAMQQTGIDAAAAQAKLDRDVKVDEFTKSHDLDTERLAEDVRVDNINSDIAYKTLDKKDMLEKALGPLTPNGGSGSLGGIPGGLGGIVGGLKKIGLRSI